MAQLLFNLTVIFKAFVRDRRGNVNTIVVNAEQEADSATLYTPLPKDYSAASDTTKTAIKTAFLNLAKQHANACGKFKFIDENSVYLSAKGVGVNFRDTQRVVVATGTVEIPD